MHGHSSRKTHTHMNSLGKVVLPERYTNLKKKKTLRQPDYTNTLFRVFYRTSKF